MSEGPISLTIISPARPIADKVKLIAAIHMAVQDTVVEGQRFMANYPSQVLTKTHYKRTGTLKRSWHYEVHSGMNIEEGIVGSNGGMAPYNIDVQGNIIDQMAMFRGAGWQNIDDLKEKINRELPVRLDNAVRKATE